MKVAIVIPHASNSPSGELRQLRLAKHLEATGIVCDVFRCSRERDDAVPAKGAYAGVQFCVADNPEEPDIPSLRSVSLMRRLTEGHYDVIVFRGMRFAVNDAVIETFGSRIRYANIPGGVFRDRKMKHYGFIFYEHKGQRDFYMRELTPAPTLHPMPKYIPENLVAAARQVPKTHDISVVSKFDARKNHKLIYPLFGTDLRLSLIGSGPLQAEAQQAAAGHPNVSFPGSLKWDACIMASAAGRMLAHPSIYEGLPRAVVEAASAGLPLVALHSTLGAALEGESFCDLVEESEFCDAVRSLAADEARLAEMSQAARAYYDNQQGPDALKRTFDAFVAWLGR